MAPNQRFCNGMIHVIKKGDNLYQLSRMYRVPLALILRANPYVDVYNLQPGQEICIPMRRPHPGMRAEDPKGEVDDRNSSDTDAAESARQEQIENAIETAREREAAEDAEAVPQEENCDENSGETDDGIMEYCSDGTKSLGEILEEFGADISEFLEKNELHRIIIAADVVLYLPKKV